MTGPTPTPPPKNEAEYAKKLALAILSTLEQKGLLSRLDVDTILHAAHRSAASPTPPVQPLGGPAALGTRWVKAETASRPADAAAQASSGPQPTIAQPAAENKQPNKGTIVIGDDQPEEEKNSTPPVIDFSLD